jgi:uncharacterized HAD superfamily protein
MTPIICFDIDGVIAEGTIDEVYSDAAGWAYEKCTPVKSTINIIWELRNKGAYIILNTARPKRDYTKTVEWLFKHGVVYDELIMDKPYAHLYIDDKNFPVRFDPHSAQNRLSILKAVENIELP